MYLSSKKVRCFPVGNYWFAVLKWLAKQKHFFIWAWLLRKWWQCDYTKALLPLCVHGNLWITFETGDDCKQDWHTQQGDPMAIKILQLDGNKPLLKWGNLIQFLTADKHYLQFPASQTAYAALAHLFLCPRVWLTF